MRMRWSLAAAVALLLVAACARQQQTSGERVLTERERDSLISRSSLPGASAVGRAMSESDAATRRAKEMEAQVDSMPR